jgi:hypothetical protein
MLRRDGLSRLPRRALRLLTAVGWVDKPSIRSRPSWVYQPSLHRLSGRNVSEQQQQGRTNDEGIIHTASGHDFLRSDFCSLIRKSCSYIYHNQPLNCHKIAIKKNNLPAGRRITQGMAPHLQNKSNSRGGFSFFDHSVRNASSGSSRAAFMAGATPAAMPISNDTAKAAAI